MILTSGELIEFMENTLAEEWPSPRGYGYGKGAAGKRLKVWHIKVVTEFLNRMAGGDHRPRHGTSDYCDGEYHDQCEGCACECHAASTEEATNANR